MNINSAPKNQKSWINLPHFIKLQSQ